MLQCFIFFGSILPLSGALSSTSSHIPLLVYPSPNQLGATLMMLHELPGAYSGSKVEDEVLSQGLKKNFSR